MNETNKPSEPEIDLEKLARDLSALRYECEQRLGRCLAILNHYSRQIEKRRKADAARGGGQ